MATAPMYAPAPFATFPSITPPPPFYFGAPPPSPSYHAAAYHHHHRFQLPPPSQPNPHWHQGMQQMQPPPPAPGNPWHPHHAAAQPPLPSSPPPRWPPPSSPPPLAASMAAVAPAWPFPSASVPTVQEGAAPSTSSSGRLPDSPGTTSAPAAALIVLCSGPGPERRPCSPSSTPVPAPSATQARRPITEMEPVLTTPTTDFQPGQHHILDTSSCSDYETSAMTGSSCPTLQCRVLSVVMHQVKHPVPIDVLNHLFSVYGVVETICQSLNQHGRKVLIQYQHGYMADNALKAAHGWCLYHTYCQLDIKQADPVELQLLHDYSCALFSEIINDAENESTAMPQNEVSDCSQLVTLHMKGHTSEQQVQSKIPVFNVVIIGTHELKQRGGKHDAAIVPNERVIEQPTLMQVLEELPSFHASKVAVPLCNSEVVHAATMLGQGNPASSTPLVMHVDDPQLPTHVQDTSDLFEAMPVFDVYDDELDVCSNEFAQVFTDTPGQQPYEEEQHDTLEQQQLVKEKASVNVQQLRAPRLNVLPLHERRKEWDPGVPVLPHSYTAPHPIVTHPGDFTCRLQPIFASPVRSSIYLWLQVLTERIATENSLSWLPIPELAKWQSQVTCASFVWDPGTSPRRHCSRPRLEVRIKWRL